MKIIIVEDEELLRELIVCLISIEFESEIFEAGSGNEAIQIIKSNPDISLILSDYNMPNGNGGDLYKYVRENCGHIPFILVSAMGPAEIYEFKEFYKDNPDNSFFSKPYNEESLLNLLRLYLVDVKKDFESYRSIDFSPLLILNKIEFDIYIKLSHSKFVKILGAGNKIDVELLNHYKRKNISEVFVSTKDHQSLLLGLGEILRKELERENNNLSENINLQLHALALIKNNLSDFNISNELILTIDSLTKSLIKEFEKAHNLSHLMKKIKDTQGHLYKHSLMLSYFSCHLSSELGWKNNSTYEKLCAASYLHDFHIESNDICISHDEIGFNINELPVSEKEKILLHPVEMANLVTQIPHLPQEVSNIILCHHERPDGNGFPRNLSPLKIPPLACAFIISEIFISSYLKDDNLLKKTPEFIDKLRPHYTKGNFKNIFIVFEKIMNKTSKI